MQSRSLAAAASVAALWLTACQSAPADDAARGKMLFAYCAPCHGPDATGTQRLGAPAIAGLPQWYVERQLHYFRDGLRGLNPDDAEGMRMRPMSMVLANPKDVALVSTYVASLPAVKRPVTLTAANAQAGQGNYAVCIACHGLNGQGNPLLNAPPLAFSDDWYLKKQYLKFQTGMRGADPKDVTGATMRPMSMLVKDDAALNDLFAYINTLSGQAQ